MEKTNSFAGVENEGEVYSKTVKSGKRTYFFNVRETRGGDYFVTITESKKKVDSEGNFTFEKHKIFLYKEDFQNFREAFEEVITFAAANTKAPFFSGTPRNADSSSEIDKEFDAL